MVKKNVVKNSGPFNLFTYGRGLVRGYVLSLLLFLLFGIIITYTMAGEGLIPLVTTIVMILGVVYGAIYTVAHIGTKGWLHGALIGLVFMLLLVILSKMFLTEYTLDRYVGYRLLISIAAGSVGGMIGINIK